MQERIPKWISILPVLCLYVIGSKSQSLTSTEVATHAADSSYNHLLWEISGLDMQYPAYLYGTIHIIPNDSFFVAPIVDSVLSQSDHLVTEIVLDSKNMMATAMSMLMPPPNSLKTLLSEEDYAYLDTFMKDSLSFPIPMYQMIKPIFLAQQVSVMYCLKDQPNSYELYFTKQFQESDKTLSGLETVEEQIQLFNDIPLEEQADELMEMIKSPSNYCSQFQDMFRLYRQRDLDALMLMIEDDPTLTDRTGSLLVDRNRRWIEPLEKLLGKEKVFIAVGAAHLPGKDGVITLLRNHGYVLKPLY